MIKWIFAIAGYALSRRLSGAFVGYLAGYLIEQLISGPKKGNTGGGQTYRTSQRSQEKVTPKDFELNLLSLASLIIKADGKVNQAELDYVRLYFVRSYGKERSNATFKVFNEVIKKREINAFRIATYISQHTRYESRLQILHFLFGIAKSDGHITANEEQKIREIAGYFRIHNSDFQSIRAMFYSSGGGGSQGQVNNAYKILDIEKTATDSEIKKAYRSMAKKYHPDKLQHLPEHLIKGAEEKFRAVQEAYDQLQKERGFK